MIYALCILLLGIIIVCIHLYLNRKDLFPSNKDTLSKTLYFKNNPSAFKYAQKYWSPDWVVGRVYVGLLIENIEDTNQQDIFLKIAANDSLDILAVGSIEHIRYKLRKGHLVYWILTDAIDTSSDGVDKVLPAGVIIAVINPILDIQNNSWQIRERFTT